MQIILFAADGTSDDIDVTVRELFDDTTYVKKHHLASPSSLNFARIVIQMVHFFYTYLKVHLSGCAYSGKQMVEVGGGNEWNSGPWHPPGLHIESGHPVKKLALKAKKGGGCILTSSLKVLAPGIHKPLHVTGGLSMFFFLIFGS